MDDSEPITRLLQQAEAGEPGAMERVMANVYDDLRKRARAYMSRQGGAGMVTLQPTALVNETYMKLLRQRTHYANRDHFLAIATRVMLRVLIDYQRQRGAQKRGGDQIAVTLTGIGSPTGDPAGAVSDVAAALDRLDELDPRKGNVVKLRAIWGFEMPEIADMMEISLSTAERDWRFARSWLADQLDG